MATLRSFSSLSDSAASRLREQIFNGLAGPGTRLAEAAVAKKLGVSRVPVREALVLLEREGLVEFSPTGRAIVKHLMPRDFEELYVLRLALEPLASRMAAARLRGDVSPLEENLIAIAEANSVAEVTRLDLEFHEIILAAAGNERLLKLWQSMRGELELWLGRLQRTHQLQTRDTQNETASGHRAIIDGFLTESPAACERLMREHIQGWREWLPIQA